MQQLGVLLLGVAVAWHCSRQADQGRRCWMGLLLLMAGVAQRVAAPAALQQGTSRRCPRHAAW